MSEVCDALVIVVSEETGLVSVAMGGTLTRGIKREELREKLSRIQYRSTESRRDSLYGKDGAENEEI